MRQTKNERIVPRREMIRSGLRWLIAGGLAMTGGVLTLRSGSDRNPPVCPPDFICRDCGWKRSCDRVGSRPLRKPVGRGEDHGPI